MNLKQQEQIDSWAQRLSDAIDKYNKAETAYQLMRAEETAFLNKFVEDIQKLKSKIARNVRLQEEHERRETLWASFAEFGGLHWAFHWGGPCDEAAEYTLRRLKAEVTRCRNQLVMWTQSPAESACERPHKILAA